MCLCLDYLMWIGSKFEPGTLASCTRNHTLSSWHQVIVEQEQEQELVVLVLDVAVVVVPGVQVGQQVQLQMFPCWS